MLGPMNDDVTFGEYVRRLRRRKRWNLQTLSDESGLSYTHLSRIEGDSTLPGPETVSKLHQALGGNLKEMLELADCLPREILDRIMKRERRSPALRRSANLGQPDPPSKGAGLKALELVQEANLKGEDASEAAEAIERFLRLRSRDRSAVATLVAQLEVEDAGED